MTNWDRVQKQRSRGRSWSQIADDPKVEFDPPAGSASGRALKALYFQRKARGNRLGGTGRSGKDDAPAAGLVFGTRRRILVLGVAALLVVSALTYVVVFLPQGLGTNVVTYCGGEGSGAHYHPLLVVDLNGVQQPLPYDPSQSAGIGVINSPIYTNPALYCPATASGQGMHALHTHSGSGIIHAELPVGVRATPTLGDFFEVWGQPLDHSSVWSFSGVVSATMLDMDTGERTDYSSSPGSIPLYAPAAGPKANPFPLPPSLSFNGQYGDGQPGEMFSGEIVWLNVSTTPNMMSTNMACDCSAVPCLRADRYPALDQVASKLPARDRSPTTPAERLQAGELRTVLPSSLHSFERSSFPVRAGSGDDRPSGGARALI